MKGILAKLFLRWPLALWINLLWGLGVLVFVIIDRNSVVPVVGAVWFGVFSALYWNGLLADYPAPSARRLPQPWGWRCWLIVPGSFLVLCSLSLLLSFGSSAGGFGVIEGPYGPKLITDKTIIVFHVPAVETITWWDAPGKIAVSNVLAVTKDNKTVVAEEVTANLSFNNQIDAEALKLAMAMSPRTYRGRLEEAVEVAFARIVEERDLNQLANPLVIEVGVGENLGLEGLATQWTGTIIVSGIHVHAPIPDS